MDAAHIDPNRLAAIVYDDGVAVDALMSAFARELVEAGVAARGVVQLPPEEGGLRPSRADAAAGRRNGRNHSAAPGSRTGRGKELVSILQPSPAHRRGCVSRRCSRRTFCSSPNPASRRPGGGGFRAELAFAVGEGRTTLTAVKRGLVPKLAPIHRRLGNDARPSPLGRAKLVGGNLDRAGQSRLNTAVAGESRSFVAAVLGNGDRRARRRAMPMRRNGRSPLRHEELCDAASPCSLRRRFSSVSQLGPNGFLADKAHADPFRQKPTSAASNAINHDRLRHGKRSTAT